MKSNNTGKLIVRLFVFVISLILVGADLVSSAQNANSGTTTQEETPAQNDNMSGMNMNRGGRRRRGRRRSGGNMNANANAPATTDANTSAQENTNTSDASQENTNTAGEATGNTNAGGRRRRRGRRRGRNMNATDTTAEPVTMTEPTATAPVRTGRCDPMTSERTDLSGTYTGTANYSEGGLSGDATLTITGNDFTLTGGGSTVEGRVAAVTTCNYTAVTMRFGKDASLAPSPTPPPPLPIVSLRARRTGGGLVLETVPGESRQFSFRSAGAPGGGRRGMRGGMKRGIKPPTATGHDH